MVLRTCIHSEGTVNGFKVLGRRPAYKVAFRFFQFFHQLSPTQKYIYTGPIRKFLDVLKSYESESFISAVYAVRSEILVPP